MDAAPIPLETLLAHREWVRAVARAVVHDPNAADDVEQETWLAALKSPPRHESSLRGWFGAVARSRARRIGRTDTRREAREIAASRGESTTSAAELAEVADTHRRVVAAVVALDEPFRETILLRYFEGLSIEDVAARTGAPVETTRSRIKRGVAKLRERLARELGTNDRPWHAALAPLAMEARKSAASTAVGAGVAGGIVMAGSTTKLVAAVAVMLLLAGMGAVLLPKWTATDAKVVAAAPDEEPAATKSEDVVAKRPTPQPRAARPRAVEAPPTPAEPPKSEKPAVETTAQKLARIKLSADWKDAPIIDICAEIAARTGVEIAVSVEVNELWARNPENTKVDSLHLEDVSAAQILKLVAMLKGIDYVIEEPRVVIVPKGVQRDTSRAVIVPPPWTPPTPLTVVGSVVDENGGVVQDAEILQVGSSERSVGKTDVAGRFEIKLTKPYGSLQACAAGKLSSLAVSVDGQPGAQTTVELTLPGPAGSVAVRVLADGRPMPSVLVVVGPRQEAKVTLLDGRTAVRRALMRSTDEKGLVNFAAVGPGTAAVAVDLRGYERFSGTVEVTAGQASPAMEIRLVKKASLKDRLASTRISFNFTNAHPGEVIQFINDAKSLSIILDPAAREKLASQTVSLSVADRPLADVLQDLCTQLGGMKYEINEAKDVVWIRAIDR